MNVTVTHLETVTQGISLFLAKLKITTAWIPWTTPDTQTRQISITNDKGKAIVEHMFSMQKIPNSAYNISK